MLGTHNKTNLYTRVTKKLEAQTLKKHKKKYTYHKSITCKLLYGRWRFVGCKSGLGRLAAWHLPGGPVGLPVRWAATSRRKWNGGGGPEELI